MNGLNSRIASFLIVLTSLVGVSPVSAQTWSGGTSNWDKAGNWTPSGVPHSGDTATFGTIGNTGLTFTKSNSVGTIDFIAGAQAYTFSVSGGDALTFTSGGILNSSGVTQTFNVNATILNFNNSSVAGSNVTINNSGSGEIQFNNNSSAAFAQITNTAATTYFNNKSDAGGATITNNSSGQIQFLDNSSAQMATITNNSGGATYFFDNSKSGGAIIENVGGGQTIFEDTSSAQTALITNSTGGSTTFFNSSTAGHSTINTAGTSVVFHDTSTAGNATFNNTFDGSIGGVQFYSTSTAGNATFNNTGGYTAFLETSNAGSATIINDLDGSSNQGVTDFYNSSDAMTAKITNQNGSVTYFYDTTTADSANIINKTGGYTQFSTSATAANAVIKSNQGATIFLDNTTADHANITDTNSSVLYFENNSSAGSATISSKNSVIAFSTTASADLAQITNLANSTTIFSNSSTGYSAIITNDNKGSTIFQDTSTADAAVILNDAGGSTTFMGNADAARSVVANVGGTTYFAGKATGAAAVILNDEGGSLDISGLTKKSLKLGAVDGSGNIFLGKRNLTILGVPADFTPVISGVIADGGVSGGTGGSLTLNSAGSLTLAGANTYTGGTTLTNGTLIAANSAAFGTGIVTVKNGTLETDNVNHVITVGNNFVQNGGTLVININGAPGAASNDVVNVNGTAKLNGNLTIKYNAGSIVPNQTQTYTIVATTGGITSAGAGYTSPPLQSGALTLLITGEVVGNDFDVQLTGIQGTFSNLPGTNYTPNQRNFANYLDRFDTTIKSGPVIPLLQALDGVSGTNPGALGSAFDQLTPLRFGSFASTTAFNNAAFFSQQFDSYLASHRGKDGTFMSSNGAIDYSGLAMTDPNTAAGLQNVRSHLLAWSPAPNTGLLSDSGNLILGGVDMKDIAVNNGPTNLWNVFVSGNVVLAQDYSNSAVGLAGANSTTGAVQVGADYKISKNWLVGAMFGYGHTDATLDTIGSTASVDTYSPTVYASYSSNGWFANVLGSYGFADYSQNRHVSIGGFNGTATSNPGGDQIVGNLDGGYEFHKKGWTYGPTAGLGYTHLDVNSYTEAGLPGADLNVNAQHADSLRSRLGGQVSYAFQGEGLTFTPHFSASWQHEFLNQSRGITSQFNSVGAGSFLVATANPSQNSALVDLGLDIQVNDALTAFVDYAAQAGQDNYFGQSVQGGFKIGF